MNERIEFRSRGGWKIVGVLHLPKKKNVPGVVICHGFTANKNSGGFFELAETLRKAGFATLRIDLYGSGESSGKFERMTVTKQVKDLRGALDFMEKHPNIDSDRLGVIGSSLGGMVATVGASKDKRIKSLFLRYPLSDIKETVNTVFSKVSEDGLEYTDFVDDSPDSTLKIRYDFYLDAIDNTLYNITNKIKCPVLIMHGTSDAVVPFSQSKKLVHMLGKSSKLKRVWRAGHDFNESQQRRFSNEAVKWFGKYLEVKK